MCCSHLGPGTLLRTTRCCCRTEGKGRWGQESLLITRPARPRTKGWFVFEERGGGQVVAACSKTQGVSSTWSCWSCNHETLSRLLLDTALGPDGVGSCTVRTLLWQTFFDFRAFPPESGDYVDQNSREKVSDFLTDLFGISRFRASGFSHLDPLFVWARPENDYTATATRCVHTLIFHREHTLA